jgi:lauroyl/myristoyl acyltransferase
VTTQRLADIIFVLFRVIPVPLRRALFTGFFRMFYHLVPRQRLIALYNLRRAFPEKSEEEIVRIAKGVYRNLWIVAAEFFDLPRLTKENIGKLDEAEGLENCTQAMAKGRGALLFGAHFGNWELEAVAVSLLIKPLVVIYRPLDSELLDCLVLRVRSSTGRRMFWPIPSASRRSSKRRSGSIPISGYGSTIDGRRSPARSAGRKDREMSRLIPSGLGIFFRPCTSSLHCREKNGASRNQPAHVIVWSQNICN